MANLAWIGANVTEVHENTEIIQWLALNNEICLILVYGKNNKNNSKVLKRSPNI